MSRCKLNLGGKCVGDFVEVHKRDRKKTLMCDGKWQYGYHKVKTKLKNKRELQIWYDGLLQGIGEGQDSEWVKNEIRTARDPIYRFKRWLTGEMYPDE